MSVGRFLQQAAAGNAGGAVYVEDVFSTYVYAGTSSENQIVNGIDLAGEGGLLWLKKRSGGSTGATHSLIDTERGRLVRLQSNTNGAETSFSQLDSFNSDGFTIPSTAGELTNLSGKDYVSWTFRKQPGFFDVVTYTGDGVAGRTVSHNLGSTPGMIIVKRRDGTNDWQVYHRGVDATAPEDYYLPLNQTDARIDSNVRWNDTAPTATEFTVGSSGATNASGGTYVAYLFAHDAQDFGTDSDESIIKCGSLTTDGSGNASVNLGWEPQWILAKTSTQANQWVIVDTMRGLAENGTSADKHLWANSTNSEMDYAFGHPTATGFEAKSLSGNQTYIYVAIRRPHKPASEFAATDLFAIDTRNSTGDGQEPGFRSGFPVDMNIFNPNVTSSNAHRISGRLTGNKYLESSSTNAELTGSTTEFDYMNGWLSSGGTSADAYSWMFRRAPGFFDVVAYTGTGSQVTVPHNLGVVPELIINKARTSVALGGWYSLCTLLSSGSQLLRLDSTAAASGEVNLFPSAPTAENYYVDSLASYSNANYISYLFATVPGISKVGTFNRPSQVAQDIDCGFENGARFVLIKRTNTTGNWVLWDSTRGIVAGNEPYLLTNINSPQVTNQDYIDPLSSGFTLTSGIATGDWVFLAIA